jgi:hypothetical protein
MKKFISLITILIGFSISCHAAADRWDMSSLNKLIEDIKHTVPQSGNSDESINTADSNRLMDILKHLAIALGNSGGALFTDVKEEVANIIHNYNHLKETDDAHVTYDEANRSASVHVYRKLPSVMADELALPTKWEVYNVNVKNIPSAMLMPGADKQRP